MWAKRYQFPIGQGCFHAGVIGLADSELKIINKTPIDAVTNQIIGRRAPSAYYQTLINEALRQYVQRSSTIFREQR